MRRCVHFHGRLAAWPLAGRIKLVHLSGPKEGQGEPGWRLSPRDRQPKADDADAHGRAGVLRRHGVRVVRLLHLWRRSTPIIAKNFFSAARSRPPACCVALAIFAAGLLFRPLGALIFGRIGDRFGRKGAFLATVSHHGRRHLRHRPPADLRPGRRRQQSSLLIVLRILQGTGRRRRIWRRGDLCRRARCARAPRPVHRLDPVVRRLRPARRAGHRARDAHADRRRKPFDAWGWRIPFLLSAVLLAISIWMRLQLNESPAFEKMKTEGTAQPGALRRGLPQVEEPEDRPDRAVLGADGAGRRSGGAPSSTRRSSSKASIKLSADPHQRRADRARRWSASRSTSSSRGCPTGSAASRSCSSASDSRCRCDLPVLPVHGPRRQPGAASGDRDDAGDGARRSCRPARSSSMSSAGPNTPAGCDIARNALTRIRRRPSRPSRRRRDLQLKCTSAAQLCRRLMAMRRRSPPAVARTRLTEAGYPASAVESEINWPMIALGFIALVSPRRRSTARRPRRWSSCSRPTSATPRCRCPTMSASDGSAASCRSSAFALVAATGDIFAGLWYLVFFARHQLRDVPVLLSRDERSSAQLAAGRAQPAAAGSSQQARLWLRFSSVSDPPCALAIASASVRPRPAPPVSPIARRIAAHERPRRQSQRLFRHARSVVLDAHQRLGARPFDTDSRAAFPYADRIVDQVAQRPAEQHRPARHRRASRSRSSVTGAPVSA